MSKAPTTVSTAEYNGNQLAKFTNRVTYLVRLSEGGYNTVRATDQKDAEKQAKALLGKYGIVSVALPKPGEIEALDAEWASRLN
jgi:hypothetical protein